MRSFSKLLYLSSSSGSGVGKFSQWMRNKMVLNYVRGIPLVKSAEENGNKPELGITRQENSVNSSDPPGFNLLYIAKQTAQLHRLQKENDALKESVDNEFYHNYMAGYVEALKYENNLLRRNNASSESEGVDSASESEGVDSASESEGVETPTSEETPTSDKSPEDKGKQGGGTWLGRLVSARGLQEVPPYRAPSPEEMKDSFIKAGVTDPVVLDRLCRDVEDKLYDLRYHYNSLKNNNGILKLTLERQRDGAINELEVMEFKNYAPQLHAKLIADFKAEEEEGRHSVVFFTLEIAIAVVIVIYLSAQKEVADIQKKAEEKLLVAEGRENNANSHVCRLKRQLNQYRSCAEVKAEGSQGQAAEPARQSPISPEGAPSDVSGKAHSVPPVGLSH